MGFCKTDSRSAYPVLRFLDLKLSDHFVSPLLGAVRLQHWQPRHSTGTREKLESQSRLIGFRKERAGRVCVSNAQIATAPCVQVSIKQAIHRNNSMLCYKVLVIELRWTRALSETLQNKPKTGGCRGALAPLSNGQNWAVFWYSHRCYSLEAARAPDIQA